MTEEDNSHFPRVGEVWRFCKKERIEEKHNNDEEAEGCLAILRPVDSLNISNTFQA